MIFLEVSKEGYFRASGYTGSKDDGDQEQILNANAKNPARVATAAQAMVDDIVDELRVVLEKNPPTSKPATPAPARSGRGRTK